MDHRTSIRRATMALAACFAATALCMSLHSPPAPAASPASRNPDPPHNVILFVADGMRHGSIDPAITPALAELRAQGVDFVNSHSLMPTITTANASAIATGHLIGDTGNFSNNLFTGSPSIESDMFSVVANVENDAVLRDLDAHFSGNYLGETTLLAAARRAGYHTAAIGKCGPTVMQDLTQNDAPTDQVATVLIDDVTGIPGAAPLLRSMRDRIAHDPYLLKTYFDNDPPRGDPLTAPRGPNGDADTHVANVGQQQYFIDVVTHAVLPAFADPAGDHKPFVMVYWSRDPDGTQHNQGDSPDALVPGINGPTVKAAFQNVDHNLKQLRDFLAATPDPAAPGETLADTTDIFITSDHGFGTSDKKFLDAAGAPIDSFASHQHYLDVPPGSLPPGFLSIDLAHDLNLPLFDAIYAQPATTQAALRAALGPVVYPPLRLASDIDHPAEHPFDSSAMIGGYGIFDRDGFSTQLVIATCGGTDLLYFPAQRTREGLDPPGTADAAFARKIVGLLLAKPYVSGVFVDTDRFGVFPGALALSDIGLRGSARTPMPAILVGFRSFSTDPQNPFMTGCEITDSGHPTGRGMHGSLGRHDTYNCMMAIGPDFKKSLADHDPVSNADIALTLARVLHLDLLANARGPNHGRVITEALANGPAPRGAQSHQQIAPAAANGLATVLLYQTYADESGRQYRYFDAAGFPGKSVGIPQ